MVRIAAAVAAGWRVTGFVASVPSAARRVRPAMNPRVVRVPVDHRGVRDPEGLDPTGLCFGTQRAHLGRATASAGPWPSPGLRGSYHRRNRISHRDVSSSSERPARRREGREHTPPTGPQSVGPAIVGGVTGRPEAGDGPPGAEDGRPLLGVERQPGVAPSASRGRDRCCGGHLCWHPGWAPRSRAPRLGTR